MANREELVEKMYATMRDIMNDSGFKQSKDELAHAAMMKSLSAALSVAVEELLGEPIMAEVDQYGEVIYGDFGVILPTARLIAERVMGMCIQNRRYRYLPKTETLEDKIEAVIDSFTDRAPQSHLLCYRKTLAAEIARVVLKEQPK